MAVVTIPEDDRTLQEPESIASFLRPYGITYEQWPLEERVDPDASPEAILDAYGPEIERLKEAGGYVTADVINVTPETPNLDAMLQKFAAEHTHSEDEVRFILKGRGIFHIHADDGKVFAIEMQAGDLISVPTGTRHWFNLCEDRTVRAIRLFQDSSGWTPHYLEDGVHARYMPVCWGPKFISPAKTVKSVLDG